MSKRAEEAAENIGYIGISYKAVKIFQEGVKAGYKRAEKDMIERICKQVKRWMPEKNWEEHTCGERVAFNSVLHLLEEMEKE